MDIPNELNGSSGTAGAPDDGEDFEGYDGLGADESGEVLESLDSMGAPKGGDYSRAGRAAAPPAPPEIRLVVPDALCGKRLDVALAALLPEHSRSRLQAWIRDGRVTLDGRVTIETKLKLNGRETLCVLPGPAADLGAGEPEAIDFPVLHEDPDLIVIDKPAGLVVHPGSGNWTGTLLNGLLHRYPELAALPRAGIVHRLDKDTSGLMVVARNLTAQTDLVRQLQARTVKRQYQAVVIGVPLRESGVIDAPIGRHPTQRTKMAVVETGKPARTRFRVIELLRACALVQCDLETGRTHQIRVHLASLKLPLVGDALYRGRVQGPPFHRQALHARKLGLVHPNSRKSLEWTSPLPDDMADLIESLREPSAPDELDESFDPSDPSDA